MKDELVGETTNDSCNKQYKSFDYLCISPFREHYLAGTDVRQLGLSYGKLVWNESLQLDLFSEPEEQISEMELNYLIDKIRQKFGFRFNSRLFFVGRRDGNSSFRISRWTCWRKCRFRG